MALSLKRLLNDYDDVPIYGNGSRPRLTNGHESVEQLYEEPGESLDDFLGSLGVPDHDVFGPEAELQQWMDDTLSAGQFHMSPPDNSSTSGRVEQSPDSHGDIETSHGLRSGDICYGMLYNADVRVVGDMSVLDARLKTPSPTNTLNQRFQLRDKGDHIQLSFDNGTEFGYLRGNMTKSLSRLLATPALYFEAVVGTDSLRETIGRISKPAEALVRVNIHIYGPPSEADFVGSQLSTHKLWLQKPDQPIRDVVYKNPQFLEFEGIDASTLENPTEILERGRPKPRTEEEHLRQTMAEVYGSSKRQQGLTQVDVSGRFKTTMLRHQREALDFMIQRETGVIPESSADFRLWKEKVVEGVTTYEHSITKTKSRIRPDEKGGGILADEMGMGKSLSILSLIVQTLKEGQQWAEKRRSMDVAGPRDDEVTNAEGLVLINNWYKEIEFHLEDSLKVIRYHGPGRPKDKSGLADLEDSDVVITTYNTLAKEFSDRQGPTKSSLLHDIEWYRVVLDEAHIIRRQATLFHRTCVHLRANSRWCLTGTPIQNKLEDIGALFCFIRAKPFDGMAMFRRYIVVPYDQGDDETAISRLVLLNDSLCLRRTKELLDLPDLHPEVRRLDLNADEKAQYEKTRSILYRKIRQKAGEHEQTSKFGIFQASLQLRIMCNHGTFQQPFSWSNEHSLRDMKEALLSELGGNAQINCNGCAQPMPVLGSNKVYNDFVEQCSHVLCSECLEEAAPGAEASAPNGVGGSGGGGDVRKRCPLCAVLHGKEAAAGGGASGRGDAQQPQQPQQRQQQQARARDGELDDEHYFRRDGHSTKMNQLITDVQKDLDKTKSIVFSCWTRTLNLVAQHLRRAGIRYSRIDGTCPLSQRQQTLDDFAKKSGPPVLIMTTGTGAFGLNLTCANRVFIVELQWNPSVENQAIARAIRLGQDQQVSVIRYIMNNTVEQDMQSQQKRKLMMAQKGFEDTEMDTSL